MHIARKALDTLRGLADAGLFVGYGDIVLQLGMDCGQALRGRRKVLGCGSGGEGQEGSSGGCPEGVHLGWIRCSRNERNDL